MRNGSLSILHLEGNTTDAELIYAVLANAGLNCNIARVDRRDAFLNCLENPDVDLILADYSLPQFDGESALVLAKKVHPDLPFIFVSRTFKEEVAVEMIKKGARDCVLKQDLIHLPVAIRKAMQEAKDHTGWNEAERPVTDQLSALQEQAYLLDLAHDAIVTCNENDAVTFWNQGAEQMYGWAKEEALESSLHQLLHTQFPIDVSQIYVELEAKGCWNGELIQTTRCGKTLNVDSRWAMRQMEGGPKRIIEINRDITEQKKSEALLRSAETKYRTLVEKLPGIVYKAELGRSGRWHYVSPQILDILGFTQEEWLADADLWFHQVHEEDRESSLTQARKHCKGELYIAEYRIHGKDGRLHWFRDEAAFVQQDPPIAQGVMFDITELRAAHESKSLLEKQLRQVQKMDAIGQLAGGVAHDFNNILMALSGYCELMQCTEYSHDSASKYFPEVIKLVESGKSLTRQLLVFSRSQGPELSMLDLNEVVGGMEKMFRRLIAASIELEIRAAGESCWIKADTGQLEQVLMNLVINARDAMPGGGKISISTEHVHLDQNYSSAHLDVIPGAFIMLAVADTGIGIDEATRSRIFDPFFTTKEKGKGTGLGLSTVYGIVQQFSGHIWVYSEPGIGSTFKVYFPQVASDEKSAGASAPNENENLKGTERILVVDNDESVRKAITGILKLQGYAAIEARDGLEALQVVKKLDRKPQMLLTDMVMPKLDGRTLAKVLLARDPDLKVMFLTGYSEDSLHDHNMHFKGAEFIQKPFSLKVLLLKIRQLLDHPQAVSIQ